MADNPVRLDPFRRIVGVGWRKVTHIAIEVGITAVFGTEHTVECAPNSLPEGFTANFPPYWMHTLNTLVYTYTWFTPFLWNGKEWKGDVGEFTNWTGKRETDSLNFPDFEVPRGTFGFLPGTAVIRNTAHLTHSGANLTEDPTVPTDPGLLFETAGVLRGSFLNWNTALLGCLAPIDPPAPGGHVMQNSGDFTIHGFGANLLTGLSVTYKTSLTSAPKSCTIIGAKRRPSQLDLVRDGLDVASSQQLPVRAWVLAKVP